MELNSIAHSAVAHGAVPRGSEHLANREKRSTSLSSGTSERTKGIGDTVELSREGRENSTRAVSFPGADSTAMTEDAKNLDQQELAQLQQLKIRDTEVRTHEQAHLSAAGQYARGGASFTYQKGPDGASYAVGGEVGIDVSKESTPEATISKMQTIKRAALAPANPSGADKRIASQATAKESQARQELLQIQQQELLQAEASKNTASAAQVTDHNDKPLMPAIRYGSLKTHLAVYERIAAG